MLLTRENLEKREKETFAPYAVFSAEATREFPETPDKFRTAYQRDIARIIHSKSFRRLRGKTQVFVAHHGDHFRNRLTHTLEVAQISRSLARNLGLNEDLAEAIALAHDLGHTPFGHVGEEKLNELLLTYGEGFEHNRQSRRILTTLEKKYPDFDGLNVSLELLDGLHKHQSSYDQREEKFQTSPSLEAQLVNLADEIAYTNHDIDDGLRSGIFAREDLSKFALWQQALKKVDAKLPTEAFHHRAVSAVIALLTTDLLLTTEANLEANKITSLQQVKDFQKPLAQFSPLMQQNLAELRGFLFTNFYNSETVAELSNQGAETIQCIFEALITNPKLLPIEFALRLEKDSLHQVCADFLAGMTDNYANEFCARLG
ncbi:MAG: deoxyguanosinetriphosphate triphosphohydrolase [Candidatus Gracilibacteria bacterium]